MTDNDLAILGGNKSITSDGRFLNPKITVDIEKAIIEQLHETISIYDSSGIFEKLETAFAKYHNKKYALLTNSGTSAIWSMYEGANLNEGDEIICPSYTFFATNTPILFTGATPVFIDCNHIGNIDVDEVEASITTRTKAIVVTHMWGYPCEMDKLRNIADKYNILLMEDCSHAHGASYKGKKCGEWGDVAAFSLQGTKIMTGGEGGILITSNRDIYEKAIFLGHYNKRCKQQIRKDSDMYKYSITGKGMKLRAHPLAARLSYEQFKFLDKMTKQKQIFAEKVIRELSECTAIDIINSEIGAQNSWYAMVMRYQGDSLFGVKRERFVEALIAEGAVEVDIPGATCPSQMLELFLAPGEVFKNYTSPLINGKFENSTSFYNSIIKYRYGLMRTIQKSSMNIYKPLKKFLKT